MTIKTALLVCLFAILTASAQSTKQSSARAEFLNSPDALKRNVPFSEAVRAGDILFLAGQMGAATKDRSLKPSLGMPVEGLQHLGQFLKTILGQANIPQAHPAAQEVRLVL